jgi:phosphoglycolate phosphatase-like HAD superfamily hydrolase
MTAHLVWDWNGTLLDDIEAVVGAANAALAELGFQQITLDQYRELYRVPIARFYQRLLGRIPTEVEWERMNDTFHRHYTLQRAACGLAEGADALLVRWLEAGRSQSILSLYGHEELVALVRSFGIESRFVRVEGRIGPSGGSKIEHMVRHLDALEGVQARRTVVIGDAVDDATAASHVGAHAVLYTGGSQSRSSLRRAGVPVVDSLAEAVEVAADLVR